MIKQFMGIMKLVYEINSNGGDLVFGMSNKCIDVHYGETGETIIEGRIWLGEWFNDRREEVAQAYITELENILKLLKVLGGEENE